MIERKTYGQFCGLARALDRVGDRWTLLIVRELLLGAKTFRQLESALSGISPALLSKRIAALGEDGLVERNDAPARSKAVRYSLTPVGRDLEPVILEFIRWGSTWMTGGPGDDRSDPAWAPLALRAVLQGTGSPRAGTVHVDVAGTWVTVTSAGGRRQVLAGREGPADATVSCSLPIALAVASGAQPLHGTPAEVSGSRRLAAALLQPHRS